MSSEPKDWVKVAQAAKGDVTVTWTRQEDNLSVKWAVRAYVSSIGDDVKRARAGALRALSDMRQALDEIGVE